MTLPTEPLKTVLFAPPPVDLPDLGAEAHLWRIPLAELSPPTEGLRELLSPEERARADRLRLPLHRQRFVMAHAALRLVLGRYVTTGPETIVFGNGDHGKPHLVSSAGKPVPEFNLTHSGDLALLAVSPPRSAVGIDLERVRDMKDMRKVAASVFTAAECDQIFESGEADPRPAFYRTWTRKEAVSKAVGKGLSLRFDQWEILAPETPLEQPPMTFCDPALNKTWSIWDMRLADGYRAALAVDVVPEHVRFYEWGFSASA